MANNPATHQEFASVDFNGTIREDVMDQIWDISNIPLPFTDLVGTDTADNHYTEWVEDKLSDPALGGWVPDGADSDQDDSISGVRLGNHTGILTKEVKLSQALQDSDSIGGMGGLGYQVMMRQRELRRNYEANFLGIQGNTPDSGDGVTPGVPAGIGAQITQFDTGSGATGGGFSGGVWTPITPGAAVALTETMVRDAAQAAWEDGADPSVLMSVPSVIRKLSEYMFTSSSRIATLTRETVNGDQTAMGSVNVFITDVGVTMDFVANRIQQTMAANAAAVYILDPAYARVSALTGYTVDPLAKTGLADKRLMHANQTVKVLNRNAHRVLLDIDTTASVTT